MSKVKFQVVGGKHSLGIDKETGEPKYVRKGDIVEMEPSEAKKFPGKFAPVVEAVKAEDGSKKLAPQQAAAQAQAQADNAARAPK